jgi:spore germination cell wall hydrolase CwlJ-like protein
MKTLFSGILNMSIAAIVGVAAYYEFQDLKIERTLIEEEARIEQALSQFSDEDKYCLAQNIFFEARNQSSLGQAAVAWVTLNRVDHARYPTSICGVVWQDRQFSWTHDGKSDDPSYYAEPEAWEHAVEIAETILLDYVTDGWDPTNGATMYHADYVDPYWAKSYAMVSQIESHIFYKQH